MGAGVWSFWVMCCCGEAAMQCPGQGEVVWKEQADPWEVVLGVGGEPVGEQCGEAGGGVASIGGDRTSGRVFCRITRRYRRRSGAGSVG